MPDYAIFQTIQGPYYSAYSINGPEKLDTIIPANSCKIITASMEDFDRGLQLMVGLAKELTQGNIFPIDLEEILKEEGAKDIILEKPN